MRDQDYFDHSGLNGSSASSRACDACFESCQSTGKAFAEHLKRFEKFNMRWNAGSALLVPSAWLRGLVTAVFWISPPRFPNKRFSEPLEAERWAKKQLAAKLAGLDRPSETSLDRSRCW